MIDLSNRAEDCRVVWLATTNDGEIYIARSGAGIKHLYEKYKGLKTYPAMMSKEVADQLENAVIYVGNINGQQTLI